MINYECKLVVKDTLWWNDGFYVYVKYRPLESRGLYKRFYLIKHNEYCGNLLVSLERFNNMKMEDIKNALIRHIQYFSSEKSNKEIYRAELMEQVRQVKSKANWFVISA